MIGSRIRNFSMFNVQNATAFIGYFSSKKFLLVTFLTIIFVDVHFNYDHFSSVASISHDTTVSRVYIWSRFQKYDIEIYIELNFLVYTIAISRYFLLAMEPRLFVVHTFLCEKS